MSTIRPMAASLGDVVRIYRNLRNGMWSVARKDDKGVWRVAGHVKGALVKDCRLVILKGGQARVRREGRKHVHAFVEGTLEGWHVHGMGRSCYPDLYGTRITYNPHVHDTFVTYQGEHPIEGPVKYVQVNSDGTCEIAGAVL